MLCLGIRPKLFLTTRYFKVLKKGCDPTYVEPIHKEFIGSYVTMHPTSNNLIGSRNKYAPAFKI